MFARHKEKFAKIQNDTKAAVMRSPEATILLISGCQDNQLSSNGDINGLFTEALLNVWNAWEDKTFRQEKPPPFPESH